jgi:hypothetical protein
MICMLISECSCVVLQFVVTEYWNWASYFYSNVSENEDLDYIIVFLRCHMSVIIAFYIFPEITNQNNWVFHKSWSKYGPETNETIQERIIFKFVGRIEYWNTEKLRNSGIAVRN